MLTVFDRCLPNRFSLSSLDVKTAPISPQEFATLTKRLVGCPVSKVWRGHGSAIFLELGELHEESWQAKFGETRTDMKGQFTVMIEWSWRVERKRSVLFGSWSTDKVINFRLQKLNRLIVTDLSLFARLPELQIQFTNDFWLTSYHTSNGQPHWVLFEGDDAYLVKNGRVVHTHRQKS